MSTWVKVFNSMPQHPKLMLAGERASWLFVCGLCYSNEHLTNGFIARHVLSVVAPGVKNPEPLAGRLVEAKLWHVVENGWQIHDYQAHQRSATEIRGRRSADAERKAKARNVSNGSPHGQIADSEPNPSGVQADLARTPPPSQEGRRQKAEVGDTSPTPPSVSELVFDTWLASTGRSSRTVFDGKRRRVVRAALKVYPTVDVLDAVDGWRFSAHHRGENATGTVYNELTLLLRDPEHIEKFRDLKRRGVPERPPLRVVTPNTSDLLRAIKGGAS